MKSTGGSYSTEEVIGGQGCSRVNWRFRRNTTDDSDLSEVIEDPIHIGALLFANDDSLDTCPMIDRKVLKQPLQRKYNFNTLRSRYSFRDYN